MDLLAQLADYSLSRCLYESNLSVLKEHTEVDKEVDKGVDKGVDKDVVRLNKNIHFWFFFVAKYGLEAKRDLTNESKEKIEQIEEVRKNTHMLKEIKYKRVTFEEDLMYAKNISMSTLKVLCMINHLSLVIIKNKCYYYFKYGTTTHLLENNTCTLDIKNVEDIERKYYFLDTKPLKGISYYKVKDLRDIGTKLGIEIDVGTKSRLKKALYDDILIKLNQMI
jgi:hypothetical protein